MPVMTGLAAARAILAEQPNAHIVFVTCNAEPQVIRHAVAIGGLGYVLKCDAGEELLAAVHSSFEGKLSLSTSARASLGIT